MSTLLELSRVSKSFGGLVAVRDLSFSVLEGEILGLIGPNGAGKTTAFNLVAGIYKPDSGSIKISGKEIAGKKPHEISRFGISRTFQTAKPFSRMSVVENVAVGGLFGRNHVLSVRKAKAAANDILRYTSLDSKTNALAGSLTLAEQRRLELARALATNPRILMLDEVMAGLNQLEISEELALLRKLNHEKKITLVVIEHVMKTMMELCGRIVVMDQGEKLVEGTPQQVASNPEVIKAYLGEKKAGMKSEPLEPQSNSGVSS
ncbi:MAG: ABC transporter ATP-binding protein [Nitrososphaerales archaeon]